MPSPHDVAEEEENIIIKERGKVEGLSKGIEDVVVGRPDAPSGMAGVFTGKTVVITWNEVRGQGVKSYRVYRIENDGYEKVGETVFSAFIDEEIKMNSRYRYKVIAVGKTESDFSNEIEIVTEDK